MLAAKHLIRSLKTSLQIYCGLRVDLDSNKLQVPESEAPGRGTGLFRYRFTKPMHAGWYMLNVNGVKETLGHDFQLWSGDGQVVHLQIGAKATTKRIVRLSTATEFFDLTIVPGPASKDQFKVSLIRISSRFALSRMFRKLASSNGMVGRRYAGLLLKDLMESVDRVYTDYSGLMQRHVKRVDYQEWLQNSSLDSDGSEFRDGGETIALLPNVQHEAETSLDVPDNVSSMQSQTTLTALTFLLIDATDSEVAAIRKLASEKRDSLPRIRFMTHEEYSKRLLDSSAVHSSYIVAVGKGAMLNAALVPELVRVVSRLQHVRLFYSDHDVLHPSGQRTSPAFKPGWNKELLLAGNYIGNFLVIKQELLSAVGGFDISMGDSAFYDFLLRASAHLKREEVERIPRMLFSRSSQDQQNRTGMTWGSMDKEALQRHLDRNVLPGVVQPGLLDRVMRVEWQVPSSQPMVDIIIPTRDRVDLLQCCVDSIIEKTTYQHYRITVVDNGSVEPSTHEFYQSLKSNSRFNVVEYPGEFNYSAINNYAVAQTSGDIIVLLNNDTEIIDSDWLTHMVAQAARPDVGCVGAKLYYSSGLIQHAGVIVGIRGVAGHAHRFYPRDADGHCGRLKIAQNVSAVTAACLAVRRDVFEEVGGLDEVNLKVAYNDVDFCLRVLEAGYDNVWTPHVELFHHESVSRGSDDTLKKARRFQQEYNYMITRWHTDTMKDPSYNPNLALDQEDFWLAA